MAEAHAGVHSPVCLSDVSRERRGTDDRWQGSNAEGAGQSANTPAVEGR
ncbi:MAG: hypothetical protein QOH91_609 [Mycobacterium sp.]|nr:hypothetical protein [Mycobacterium sp.]